jgi:RND family efflux transporter MFP subunit
MTRWHLLGLMLVPLALAGCEKRQAAATPDLPPAVLVGEAKLEPLRQERRLAGTVKPRVEAELGFRVGGKLARRLVDAGRVVRAGDVLAELDPTDLDLQLRQAEAELAAARATLETARAELERTTQLRRQGWSTAAEFDRQRAAAEEAAGRAARAEHALGLARNARGYATLRADADGVVTAALAEPGQVLTAGQPVLRLAHTAGLEVEVAVPEALLELARGAPARASLWAMPGSDIPVRLRELSPRADPLTRTYPARFALPEEARGIGWGMTATVTLGGEGPRAVRLPLAAILDEGEGPTVFVVEPATATLRRQKVALAGLGSEFVAVAEGLAGGELVVLLGVQKLRAGQRVRPISRLPS